MSSRASRTAPLVAALRARATARPTPWCDDPWAARLAGEEGEALAARLVALQPEVELWVALRTAYLDRRVRDFAGETRPQVVILGAGLDTRAARLAAPARRFFEVDTAASATEKRFRLEQLGGYPLEAARYATCDFTHEDFLDRLAGVGFDAGTPAVFVWEGVLYYLDEAAVRATLARVAAGAHPESILLFDYVGKKMAEGRVRHPHDLRTGQELSEIGEPLRFGIDDVVPLLYEEGFRRAHVTSFDELALNFTGTYDRARRWRTQGIAETSVSARVGLFP